MVGGRAQRNGRTLPQCLGALGSGIVPLQHQTTWGRGQWKSYYTQPHCLGVVSTGTPAYTATLCKGNRRWNSRCIAQHCLTTMGSGRTTINYHTVWEKWEVDILLHIATVRRVFEMCGCPAYDAVSRVGGTKYPTLPWILARTVLEEASGPRTTRDQRPGNVVSYRAAGCCP